MGIRRLRSDKDRHRLFLEEREGLAKFPFPSVMTRVPPLIFAKPVPWKVWPDGEEDWTSSGKLANS